RALSICWLSFCLRLSAVLSVVALAMALSLRSKCGARRKLRRLRPRARPRGRGDCSASRTMGRMGKRSMSASPDEILSRVCFASVGEAGSFTAAAEKLDLSKSVVSARVAQLEDRVGVRLLNRTTRKISLTAEGMAFYERCMRLVNAADDATADVE